MGIDKIKGLNEDLKDLIGLREQINQNNKPGKVNYLRETKDYKIYSYTIATGGTKGGIKDKYINQIGPWVEGTQFTDAKGNPIKKNNFNAGEVVFLKVPKKKSVETINPTPEMTEKEISNLNGAELMNIFQQTNKNSEKDKIGEYIIVKHKGQKRKLYYTLGNSLKDLKDGHTYIVVDSFDGENNISIGRKSGGKITGVYSDLEGISFKKIYKGELICIKGIFKPKNTKK